MTQFFKVFRNIARLRVPILAGGIVAAAGCTPDNLSPDSSTPTETPVVEQTAPDVAELSVASFRRGIPIGTSALPTSLFGERYNGALRNIAPQYLLKELAAIRARGGRVILMFAGSEGHYKDRQGHFDLGKWKARVARFRGLNFSSFIADGTIVGHYLIDEPQDKTNWHGRPVSGQILEQMGQFSKSMWPNMVTIVRTSPTYLASFGISYRHIDAAWAQYLSKRGNVNDFLHRNVADAQRKGLGLIAD